MSDENAEGTFVVASELGLHARPAGTFAALAGRFEGEVEVSREGGDEWVNGQSVLGLLSLAAARGTRLHIRLVGPGAARALAELGALVERMEDAGTGI
ncbi:MAG: HPr family phosphocarrier protein [Myxococcota bacterium]|nr:HPr family phosphocarrier protein [Myxococcota bacterium]